MQAGATPLLRVSVPPTALKGLQEIAARTACGDEARSAVVRVARVPRCCPAAVRTLGL